MGSDGYSRSSLDRVRFCVVRHGDYQLFEVVPANELGQLLLAADVLVLGNLLSIEHLSRANSVGNSGVATVAGHRDGEDADVRKHRYWPARPRDLFLGDDCRRVVVHHTSLASAVFALENPEINRRNFYSLSPPRRRLAYR